jgi:alpha-glucosidase
MERIAPWWQRSVVYHIYPRSFQDGNGDGIGDLAGIEQRLDYLTWLGIDAIWISPIYPSPMKDFGYDVSDYTGIEPVFGTMEDFDRLLEAVHDRDMRLILDWVPNHTSDQHPWFVDARSSRNSAKRDWYIWRDPAPDGGPPNNWQSQAGGSAWELDEGSGQYYYHAFMPQQPDLNWRNPAVRKAMYDTLRFWLDKGVDGFRVDVIWHLMKDPEFRDDPENPLWHEGLPPFQKVQPLHSTDQPDVHSVVREMRAVLEEYQGDRLLIGEIYLPIERLVAYYGENLSGAHLPFNFQLISTEWDAESIARLVREYEAALPVGGWPNWVLGNHDQPRIASRVGPAQARVAAMLLLTLRGTPTLYYGDELGLSNVPIPDEIAQDPFGLRMPGTGQGRDPERTPMPWDETPNSGFTSGRPWLPIGEENASLSVATQRNEASSMLSLVRSLLRVRHDNQALCMGNWAPIAVEADVLVYLRRSGEQRILVALNLDPMPKAVLFRHEPVNGRILLSTHLDRAGEALDGELSLRADEGIVIELRNP